MEKGLAYVGKIIDIEDIPNADYIASATVVCGFGGKWKGIIKKTEFTIGQHCIVYLPDALITPNEQMKFMESSNWRVKMRRFKGAPSEVLIMPINFEESYEIGYDLTNILKVKKYQKPVPSHLQGKVIGEFPGFIPKTDEPNYQSVPELVDSLNGLPFYITEKADGSSTTAYKYKGKFGVCSRNWELEKDEENGYWKVAIKANLENRLPYGYALQWETCGPKIQNNYMGFLDIEGLAFNVYSISEKRYLELNEFKRFCEMIEFPTVKIIKEGEKFDQSAIQSLAEGKYDSGHEREGVVVRSQHNHLFYKPISFKIINLNYEK